MLLRKYVLLLLAFAFTAFAGCERIESGLHYTDVGDGLSSDYYLKSLVVRSPDLAGQASDQLSLKYNFASSEWANEIDVPNNITSLTITAELNHAWSKMFLGENELFNGKPSMPVSLNEGLNIVKIKVVAQDGNILEYVINVTRHTKGYEVATLSSLVVDGVTISPAFDPASTNREFTASGSVNSISVTAVATAAADGAKIQYRINNDYANPASIPLAGGLNIVQVICTAGNGATAETYTIKIAKPIESSSVNLTDLSINGLVLTPAYSPATTSYTLSIDAATKPFRLSAQPESCSATVDVTLNTATLTAAQLNDLPLNLGANTLEVTVSNSKYAVAPKTYTISITCVAASTDATLKSLKVKMGNENRVVYPGTFLRGDPSYHDCTVTAFNKNTENYATVIFGYSSITVTAVTTESSPKDIKFEATNRYNTSGSTAGTIASQSFSGNTGTATVNLEKGYVTCIDITVTAPDNVTRKVYHLYAKLLNEDEYYWGIYAPSFDKSKASWGTPSGPVHWSGTGSAGGTWKWDTGLGGGDFQGSSYGAESVITLANFNDGQNGYKYNEGGFIINGVLFAYLKSATDKNGWNVNKGRFYLKTAGGTEFVDFNFHLKVVNSQPTQQDNGVTDPLLFSYTDMTYMGATTHRQFYKNTKPYPFNDNNWFEPWSDKQRPSDGVIVP